MIDAETCTDGYNEDWKIELRENLSSAIIGTQMDKELSTNIGAVYACYAPAFLYKYYSDSNLLHWNAVKNNAMWYSSAVKFNDVFDCDIFVDEKAIFQSIIDTSPEMKRVRKGSAVWLDFKRKSYKATKQLQQMFDDMKGQVGISCLSELDNSLLMWAHYANNHRGFCVEYDLLKISKRLNFTPIPVIYSDKKISVQSLFPKSLEEYVTKLVIEAISTKSTDWNYEKEWRIIRDTKACGDKWSEGEQGALLPMIKPASIILGCEATISFQAVVEAYCKEKQINLYKMEKDRHLYKLNKKLLLSFDI